MSRALKHFKYVTFQFPMVKKIYTNHLRRVDWPKHPLRIMDIGCGSGRVLLEILEPLLPRHYYEIVGIDISPNMIDVCHKLERDPRITFDVMDIETKAIPEKFSISFDFLSSSFAFHYVKDLRRVDWPKHPLRIMDIGCGSGRVLLEILEPLLPRHYSELVGIDISPNMIDICHKLERDPRITFDVMDIETKAIPEKFSNSFDFLSSSLTLQFVKDLRTALVNCNNLLKVNGELVFMFIYGSHPLYEVYKTMSNMEEWKPYTKEFQNYVPLFRSTNPLQELKTKFNECGLDVLESELNHDPYESSAENFLALFASVDYIYSIIPNNKKQKYEKDFTNMIADIVGFSPEEKDLKKKAKMYYPAIVVRGRKQ